MATINENDQEVTLLGTARLRGKSTRTEVAEGVLSGLEGGGWG